MRAVVALALCFFFGACGNADEAEPDVYGIYDVVSAMGKPFPTQGLTGGSVELRSDGTSVFTLVMEREPDPVIYPCQFSMGDLEDGCRQFTHAPDVEPKASLTGTICGEVMTAVRGTVPFVFNKRR